MSTPLQFGMLNWKITEMEHLSDIKTSGGSVIDFLFIIISVLFYPVISATITLGCHIIHTVYMTLHRCLKALVVKEPNKPYTETSNP